MLVGTNKSKNEIKLSKADKSLLKNILNEHLFGIDDSLKDSLLSNKDKSSLKREAKHVESLKEKLGL
ncbi:MAG: hypothetical protein ACI35S_05425 [Anaeroplasma sp.]